MTSLSVLFTCAELAPWVKTGGLGDVAAALPRALAARGVEVRILVPAYPALVAAFGAREFVAMVDGVGDSMLGGRLSRVALGERLELLMLECPAYYDRPGSPYLDSAGANWSDNALRFGLLSRTAALLASRASPLDWTPHILHCNDWQTALAPAYLRYRMQALAGCVVTIHNLAFQGLFPPTMLAALGLPAHAMTIDGVEFHGQLSFLKAGLQCAERITTVSPTYRQEICTPAHGCGLDGLLRHRADRLVGILNGIDGAEWNPAKDAYLPAAYNRHQLGPRAASRAALRQSLGLHDAPGPILGMVSRMTGQKGVDLVLECVAPLITLGASFAVLGSGDAPLQAAWQALAARYPGRVGVHIGFDNRLAHLIEAGADIFLMPSRFEPCGLNQMYSLAYGTPPVVRATGGLADTVVDCNAATLASGHANGFTFEAPSATALLATTQRAMACWRQPALWRRLQRNGMVCNFSWDSAARQYVDVYRLVLAERADALV